MIIELFLQIILGLIHLLLLPMPVLDALIPVGAFAGFIELLANASHFVPVGTLIIVINLWFLYYAVQFAISIINWLIGKIPTIS